MTNNKWDELYNDQEYRYGKEPNVFVQSMLHDHPPSDVLSLSEGEGRNAVYAAELGHRVTAWDYSSVALDKLRQLADERNVNQLFRLPVLFPAKNELLASFPC